MNSLLCIGGTKIFNDNDNKGISQSINNVAGAQRALILSSTQMQQFLFILIVHYNKEKY